MRSYDYIMDSKQDAIDLMLAIHEAMAKSAEYHHKKKIKKMKKQHAESILKETLVNKMTMSKRMSKVSLNKMQSLKPEVIR